jgi:hypothetical protein
MEARKTEAEIQDAISLLQKERNYDPRWVAMVFNSLSQKIYSLEKQVTELKKFIPS